VGLYLEQLWSEDLPDVTNGSHRFLNESPLYYISHQAATATKQLYQQQRPWFIAIANNLWLPPSNGISSSGVCSPLY